MNVTARRGKLLALKFAAIQLACTGLAALVFLMSSGWNVARGAVVLRVCRQDGPDFFRELDANRQAGTSAGLSDRPNAAAFVFLALSGTNAARSAVVGGLIIALGTLVFAWRLFATDWPAASAARGFYAGELLKWIWVIGAFALALTRGGMEPLPLLIGLLAAQSGFWVAMGIFK